MAYSLLTSMSFAFWFTTSTGSVRMVPPPSSALAPALWTSRTTFSVERSTVGMWPPPVGSSTSWRPWEATCSVQRAPSHQRTSWRPNGSGYHPAGCSPGAPVVVPAACGDVSDMAADRSDPPPTVGHLLATEVEEIPTLSVGCPLSLPVEEMVHPGTARTGRARRRP